MRILEPACPTRPSHARAYTGERFAFRPGVCQLWNMHRDRTAALIVTVVWATACTPPPALPRQPPPPVPPPPIYEEEIKPVETLKLDILDLNELPSADHKIVTVTGTLINHGTRTTREVYVHVEALDKNGAVVLSAEPDPSTQTIAPDSTATFSATFENRADTDRYHVEAIGR